MAGFGALTSKGRDALAQALLHVRGQADCVSWDAFVTKLRSETGFQISASSFERLTSKTYSVIPNGGAVLYVLEHWGKFTMPNGERLTTERLYDVAFEVRDWQGNLVIRENSSH